jgi:hypothetical protein
MSNVLIGLDTSAKQLPVKHSYDRNKGATTTRTYKGTYAQIFTLESQYQWAGWSTTITEGPVWTLEATLGSDDRGGSNTGLTDFPIDTWELFANVVEKDILASNLTIVNQLTDVDRGFLRDIMEGKKNAADWDYSTSPKTPAFTSADSSGTNQLFRCIVAGMKSRPVNVPTLRHTKTASRDYDFASALTGVDNLYSTNALGIAETIPRWIYNNMPPAPTVNPFTATNGIVQFSGWHKRYPQVVVSSNAKSQIVVEWEYGDRATIMWPTYHA